MSSSSASLRNCSTAPLLSWISESMALQWCEYLARRRERRRLSRVQAHNLRRLQPRDLRDCGVSPSQFVFDLRVRRARPSEGDQA